MKPKFLTTPDLSCWTFTSECPRSASFPQTARFTFKAALAVVSMLALPAFAMILLATTGRAGAASPSAAIVSPASPAGVNLFQNVQFTIRGFDPDNDLRLCEMYVDGAPAGTATFNSPTNGATAAWTYAFTSLGAHTISFNCLDLATNYGPGDEWTIQASAQLTVLTYNTHLFEDSPLECIVKCGGIFGDIEWVGKYVYDDPARNSQSAAFVRSSGADIVAVQEVWAYSWREWWRTSLSDTYPHSYAYDSSFVIESALWDYNLALPPCITSEASIQLPNSDDYARRLHSLGNGLILLSKYPLTNFAFKRFPTHEQCALDEADKCEVWGDKGVLSATADVGGTPIRIGVSHALTGPDDPYSAVPADLMPSSLTTFQLKGEAYLFAVDRNNKGYIIRFEDYNQGAGWKLVYTNTWGSDHIAVTSFELRGHPYLFGVNSRNEGHIERINDDPSTGWTTMKYDVWGSDHIAVTSFELRGHPYLFGVNSKNEGHIERINEDPSTGWTTVKYGVWGSDHIAVRPFQLNGHPYLFGVNSSNEGHIERINDDPSTGWTNVSYGHWPSANSIAVTLFELDNHPYLFGLNGSDAIISRINDDPGFTNGWSTVWSQGNFMPTCYAVKSFNMAGRAYLFDLRNCCDQFVDSTQARRRPRYSLLWRINAGGHGCESMFQLEDIRMIRDATVVDQHGPPAILMGDFNIHANKYGIMDELFHKAGAVDAYVQVHGTGDGGETIDQYANKLMQVFWGAPPAQTNQNSFDRIDYVYVKPSGGGVRLVPTGAQVLRNWKYGADVDLSDHYPLKVQFRLEVDTAAEPAQTGWANALWLDGVDDHVSVASGVVLSSTSFTVEFRAQGVYHSGFQVVISKGSTEGLQIGFNDGNVVTFRFGADQLDGTINADKFWHHWAFTYNAPDRARKIFRDGVLIAQDNASVDYQGSGPLFIGRSPGEPPYSFAGRLDEVRIWKVARSRAEIAADLRHSLSGTEPNLVAYWTFDEGSGTTVHDLTPNGHTGTIVNDPAWMRTAPGGHVLFVSNVNQYVRATIPTLASNYTVSAWVFLRAGAPYSGPWAGVLSAANCGNSAELMVRSLPGGSSTDPQYLELGRCGAFEGTPSTGRVPINQWVHLAVTVSPTKQVNYFIDGLPAGSWDGSGLNFSLGPSVTLADNIIRRFNGLLDEVQVWSVARSQAEIAADCIYPRSTPEPNLVAYYRFDEGTGSLVYDGTANYSDDTLINKPAWTWQAPTLPYPVTLRSAGVSISAAVLNGLVNANGLETAAWFEWGPTPSYGGSTAATSVGSGTELVPVSHMVDGLNVGETYHYRVVGANSLGIAYGPDRSFSIQLVTDAGSLQGSINDAAAGDIIVLTDTGNAGVGNLSIDKDLSIAGPGAANLALSGGGAARLFNIASNVVVHISGLTIQDGHAPDGAGGGMAGASGLPGAHGGGIYNAGHLTLRECVLTGNRAGSGGPGANGVNKGRDAGHGGNGGSGGAGGSGGGIYNAESGVLRLDQCTISQNFSGAGEFAGAGGRGGDSTGVPGAGGFGGSGGQGGAGAGLFNDGNATLNRCTISGNRNGDGGNGGAGGRGGDNLPVLFIHYHWGGDGKPGGHGGAGGSGGGVYGTGQTTLINCTISDNRNGLGGDGQGGGNGGYSAGAGVDLGHVGDGGNGGGGGTGGGIYNADRLELVSCTIAYNVTGAGGDRGLPGASGSPGGSPGGPGAAGQTGGVHSDSAQPALVGNTAVALNTGAADNDDVFGAFASQGHNLVGTYSGGAWGFSTSGDLRGIDPLFGPLADNGGPTLTHEPQPASPLINAGSNQGAPATDQRGLPRIMGGTIDLGAFEVQSPQSVISYAWLQGYDLPTDGSADFQDPDGDLMSNWQEWRGGTSPTFDWSLLRMLTPSWNESGVVVSWQSAPGRNYFLQRSTNLGATPPFVTLATNLPGQWETTSYTDTNVMDTMHFYRVGVGE